MGGCRCAARSRFAATAAKSATTKTTIEASRLIGYAATVRFTVIRSLELMIAAFFARNALTKGKHGCKSVLSRPFAEPAVATF